MKVDKQLLLVAIICTVSTLLRLYISNFLIFKVNIDLLFGVLNIVLLYLIVKQLFSNRVGLICALLYSISPWTAYIELSRSLYIPLLSSTLALLLGWIYLKNKQKLFSVSLLSIGLIVFLVFSWKIIQIDKFNPFTEEGLLNTVNVYRGESNLSPFAPISKLVENKYSYFTQHLIFTTLIHLSPATYFTSQQKLLGFSFSPPIYLGFLIPTLFGLKFWSKNWRKYRYYLLASLVLTTPSIFTRISPDLARLIIFSPILFTTIGLGISEYLLGSKNKWLRFLLILTISLVTLQFVVTISDISYREPLRWDRLMRR